MLSDKAPFWVTILLAVASWTVTHIVDRVTTSPTLEYSVSNIKSKNDSEMHVSLRNLTRDTVFRNLNIIFSCNQKNCAITNLIIVPSEPGYEGDQPTNVVTGKDTAAEFKFEEIQPSGNFEAIATYSGNTMPAMRISLPGGAANIVRPSAETWLAKNEFTLLTILFAVALIGAGLFLWRTSRQKVQPKRPIEILIQWLIGRGA